MNHAPPIGILPPAAFLAPDDLAGVPPRLVRAEGEAQVAGVVVAYFDALARGDVAEASRIEEGALAEALLHPEWRDWLFAAFARYLGVIESLGRGDAATEVVPLLPAWRQATLARIGHLVDGALAESRRSLELAHHADPVTELPNLAGFLAVLRRRLPDDASLGAAVLGIELRCVFQPPDLAAILGDRAQNLLADRLRGVPRPGDVLARLERGLFALYLPGVAGASHAQLAAHRVSTLFAGPIELEGGRALVLCRVGIALVPDHALDAEDLLHCAQVATGRATVGSGGVAVYSPDMEDGERLARRLREGLRRAIAVSELEVFFHPQLDAATRRLVGLEALLRWRHGPQGFVPPLDILAAAEASGLMPSLTHWLIQNILRQHGELRRAGLDCSVSINLRPGDIVDASLADQLEQAAALWRVPPHSVVIEVTEGTVIPDLDAALTNLRRLKEGGFRVSMDDFGSGYASLTYLRVLPLDELKIDQGFVRNLMNDAGDERIVRTSIDLGHTFGLQVVAEGVETAELADRLREMGCDILQGYFAARPMPRAELIGWYRARQEAGAAAG
ncbi:MAG TPA: EAL domain-containing protein [Rhodocyclaceae bacterium]|nr:EAL domain-containing protein [Rhodocyclaceae bacterium]